ncbi:hypothetical protein MTP04_24650 [Lysinibacillus sp. PLM2]|nr:hypothetical protein MTP04_24650 [Lysinibacillus sp. PLM2]
MRNLFIILGLAHLIIAISIMCGYSPSKFEIICVYLVCTCVFFAKGIEGAVS